MKKLIVFFLLIASSYIHADNYYWVGGTGNWSDYAHHWAVTSGAQLYHNHVPTPNDTVIFDSLSFLAQNDSVVGDSAILYCHTMKWINVQFHPLFMNRTLATNSILKIYGSLSLDTGMTWGYSGNVQFVGIEPGNTISTKGKYFRMMHFTGDTLADWKLLDTLRVDSLKFTSGTFRSAGQSIICGTIRYTQSNTATILLDTSFIELNYFWCWNNPHLLDADSARFLFHGTYFTGSSQHYHRVTFTSIVWLMDSNTIDDAIFNADVYFTNPQTFGKISLPFPGTAITLNDGVQVTITDSLLVSGSCRSMNAIFGGSNSSIYKSSGSISIDDVIIDDVSATGGASFNVSNGYLNGNTSGWNASSTVSPRTLFWVNGTGDWNDTAHWSTTSGGIPGACPPTPADDVFFDAGSGLNSSDTVSVTLGNFFTRDLDWSGTSGVFVHSTSNQHDYGSMHVANTVTESAWTVYFRSDGPAMIDNPNIHMFEAWFAGNGCYTLQSDLNAMNTVTIMNGKLNTNDFPVSCAGFRLQSDTVSFGNSVLTANYCIFESAGTIADPPSIIETEHFFDATSGFFPRVDFPSGGTMRSSSQFGDVTFHDSAYIEGFNTFDSLRFYPNGLGICFRAGSSQIIVNLLSVTSSCTSPTIFRSDIEGALSSLVSANAVIAADDMIMEDISATGGANFTSYNTVAIANVNGWNIIPPPSGPMYWIGGSGNWNDPQHWSSTSGGTPGSCIPNPLTDVYFDANSFTTSNDAVSVNTPYAFCKSMIWSGVTGNPYIYDSNPGNVLWCFGSFVIDTNVTATQCAVVFRSVNGGNTVNTNNQMVGKAIFSGLGGSWSLAGDMQATRVQLEKGTFNTSGFTLHADTLISKGATRSLLLDSSFIMVGRFFISDSAGTLDADSSFIEITGSIFDGGNNNSYDRVTFVNDVMMNGSDSIRFVRFIRSAEITADNVFDTLLLDNPGYQITLHTGVTQTLIGNMLSSGTSSAMIGIESESGSATILKTTDTLCSEFLVLRGINATGGATFYAGYYSSDAGNNNGWQFQSCTPAMVDVWPGDANRDLTDDNLDLLAVGLAFGYTVNPRANATNNWTAQPNWVREIIFANGSDIVNADCDGDGVIGFSDTTAILMNYGMTHPPRLAFDSTLTTGWPLYFMTPTTPQVAGDTTSIGFMLGDNNSMINDVYGIAFTLHFEAGYIQPGTAWLEMNNAWLAPSGFEIHILHEYASNDKMDIAISRIDHQNISGEGYFGRLHFRLSNAAAGVFKCWYTDVTLIDFNEVQYPVIATLGTFPIAVGIENAVISPFRMYPNPALNSVTIESPSMSGIRSVITISDLQGRQLQTLINEGNTQMNIDITSIPRGTYFICIRNERGMSVERLVKR